MRFFWITVMSICVEIVMKNVKMVTKIGYIFFRQNIYYLFLFWVKISSINVFVRFGEIYLRRNVKQSA